VSKLAVPSWKPLAILLLSAMMVACSSGTGRGGGSEEASAGTATLLVGGPGGGSSGRSVDPSVPDGGLVPIFREFCPPNVGQWDKLLGRGDFTAVVRQTESEIDARDPALRTQALLYNSLGRLYTRTDPLEVLGSLGQVRQDEARLSDCGDKGPALLAEGSMFAHAALGDFLAAEQELAAVTAIAPSAEDDLRGQLRISRPATPPRPYRLPRRHPLPFPLR
jgi:hypothetical protein